jgi:hypothetical protein
LELDDKSKGSPSPPVTSKPGQEKDTLHEDQENGDIPGSSMLTDADQKMDMVYGDHAHQNPRTHLNGGVANNAPLQEHWQQLVSVPSHAYDVPSGAIGKWFIEKVTEELKGIIS